MAFHRKQVISSLHPANNSTPLRPLENPLAFVLVHNVTMLTGSFLLLTLEAISCILV